MLKSLFLNKNTPAPKNPHCLIYGHRGSGVSHVLKNEMNYVLENYPEDQVILLDTNGNFGNFAEEYGGLVIDLAKQKWHINPLEPNDFAKLLGDFESDMHISDQYRLITGLFELIQGKNECEVEEKKVIDLILSQMSRKHCDLKHFYSKLEAESSKQAETLAIMLNPYIKSTDIFMGETNIPYEKTRFVSINTSHLANPLRRFASAVCFASAWNAATRSFTKARTSVHTNAFVKRCWVFVDNLDYYLCTEGLSSFVSSCITRARTLGVVYYGSIYDVANVISGSQYSAVRKIINNIQNVAILPAPPYDRSILKELYKIPEQVIEKTATMMSGEGIASTGKEFAEFSS